MPSSARGLQPITRIAMAIGILAGCGEDHQPPSPSTADPIAPPRPAVVVDAAAPDGAGAPVADAESSSTIQLSIEPRPAAGTGLAKRCALGGAPIASSCTSSGGGGVAVDVKGIVYIAEGDRVRRYQRADGDECRYEPMGEPIVLPAEPVRKQRVDKPVHVRSGGPAWKLSRAGTAIYAGDFLAGLYRIDRGRAEAACVDEFGYDAVAQVGGKLLVAREGIERLTLGAKCTARAEGIDAKARGDAYAIGGTLWVAPRARAEVARYDGKHRVVVAKEELCSVQAMAPCGDGACILDHNCMQIVQVGQDDAVRVLETRALFDRRPWMLRAAAQRPDGGLLLLARHRDVSAETQNCEAALYELPASLFAQ
jgi:hypothetical protein